jgi:hypothetical protein
MSRCAFPCTIPGQWISAITIVGLIIAPFGCETAQIFSGLGGEVDLSNPLGLLINQDGTGSVLGGVRLASGESVYVYGVFNADGSIRRVTGAGLRDASGREAGVTLDNGWPKFARHDDGSTVDFTYEEVTASRVKGHVDAYIAATDTMSTVPFDIDAQAAAADLARIVADLAGLQVSAEEPPPDQGVQGPPEVDASEQAGDQAEADASAQPDKSGLNHQVTFIFVPLFAATFAAVGYTMVLVMAQVMEAMVAALAAVAAAIVAVVFAPFFIMADILRLAVGQPAATVRFSLFRGPELVFDNPALI